MNILNMERRVTSKLGAGLTVFFFGLLLTSCSGDPRPLEEAVEASNVGLVGLVIESDQDGTITLSPGEQIQFSFEATDAAGVVLDLPVTDRSWSVVPVTANGAVPGQASISDSGLLTAIADGLVEVNFRIAGIFATEVVPVRVSSAALQAITVNGDELLTECSTGSYTASGTFEGEAGPRPLRDVDWSVVANASGRLLESSETEATVGALMAGSFVLQATVGEVNTTFDVTVDQGLDTLVITPADPVNVEVTAEVNLITEATYINDTPTAVVTNLTTFSSTDPSIATVSNAANSVGVLTGVADGVTTITASCGAQNAVTTVTVVTPTNFTSLSITPNDDPIELTLGGSTVQLTVLGISPGGARFDVTDLANYEVTSGADVISVDTVGSARGEITALKVGTAVIRVTQSNGEQLLNIRVN